MEREDERREDATSPGEAGERGPEEGAAQPGGGELDEEALREGQDKLNQAGGGH